MYKTVMMFELEQTMKKENVKVIDVREIDEFSEGHIPNAIHVPMSDFVNNLKKLNKKEAYYVVCYSGARSQAASQFLSKQGYDVTNVLGGMSTYHGGLSDEV